MGRSLSPSRRERYFLVAAGLVLAAATTLRLWRLDHFSYWLDEILEARFVRGSWPDFWRAIRLDAFHPPLDYLIVRGIDAARPADWVRKLPAICWGVGTIAALGALLARRAGRTAALITMVLLAAAPFHVRYSQELRPYALGLFLLSLALLCLDRLLEKPTGARWALLYLASLGCAYALYLAAVALALAGAALVLEDCWSPSSDRRREARRFLFRSPAFIGALLLAYLPWWPVVLAAWRRAPFTEAAPLSVSRLDRTISFFAFGFSPDGGRLGWSGLLYVALMASGAALALWQKGTRFLLAWALLGFAAIEALGQAHPHFDATRRFLPAGLALVALAALPIAMLVRTRNGLAAAAWLALVVLLDSRALAAYYQAGRPDWRPLAEYLRHEASPLDKILVGDQATQVCLGFYLRAKLPAQRPPAVLNLQGNWHRAADACPPGATCWLVRVGGAPSTTESAPTTAALSASFPTADGGGVVTRLEPVDRDNAFRRLR